jgi:hypothetical protein
LGVLNLLGEAGKQLSEIDKTTLAALFASVSESDSLPPVCDVLLLYARIEFDGSVAGCSDALRTLI